MTNANSQTRVVLTSDKSTKVMGYDRWTMDEIRMVEMGIRPGDEFYFDTGDVS